MRYDPNTRVDTGLCHVADVLRIDPHRPISHIVEPKQQATHCRFTRSRRPHDRDCLAGSYVQRNPFQDRTRCIVTKVDIIKPDVTRRHVEVSCAGRILHLSWLLQQAKHFAHVHQSLSNFAIHRSQKIQRHRNLDHVGVNHYKIANR